MILSLIFFKGGISLLQMWQTIITLPQLIFFALGILGMVLMMIFAFKLNNSNVKSNWIEQLTNGISQIFIFLGILIILFC